MAEIIQNRTTTQDRREERLEPGNRPQSTEEVLRAMGVFFLILLNAIQGITILVLLFR